MKLILNIIMDYINYNICICFTKIILFFKYNYYFIKQLINLGFRVINSRVKLKSVHLNQRLDGLEKNDLFKFLNLT